jgi:hypothetical protein
MNPICLSFPLHPSPHPSYHHHLFFFSLSLSFSECVSHAIMNEKKNDVCPCEKQFSDAMRKLLRPHPRELKEEEGERASVGTRKFSGSKRFVVRRSEIEREREREKERM